MDISIIIVSYNVREFLRGAIASAMRSLEAGGLSGEVFVVDNASSDHSAEMVARDFPNVRLYALNENLGFGRANNLAMREAKGEHLLLLNPDTVLGEDTLRVMVDFMRTHPDAGLAGCKLLNGDGSFQMSCRRGFPTPWASFTKLFGLSRLFPKSKLFARYNLTYLPTDATYEVDALGGAFMLMTRAAYNATGGFDEDYFMYGEDLDLCFRTKRAGYKVYYVHSTATVHFKGESTRRSAINEVQVFYDAMHIFVKKNYPASFLFAPMLRFGIFSRTLLALAKKYRGAIAMLALDSIAVALAVLATCKIVLGDWFALPPVSYPWAVIIPPLIATLLLAALRAYGVTERRRMRQIVLAMPALLISLSSLTYFFKEYPSSRALVVMVTAISSALLIANRFALRVLDRFRFGGISSASPTLRRTLIVGTSAEAQRIASLLKRTEFIRRYEVVGFIDATARGLDRIGEALLPDIAVKGDLAMLPRLVRSERITEVIFASDAVAHTSMLETMQRVSSEAASQRVNFNMVPTATDVLLGRQKIELLSDKADAAFGLMPIELNLHRISHRIMKRLLDIAISVFALPIAAVRKLIVGRGGPTPREKTSPRVWRDILRGDLTLVGFASGEACNAYFGKRGLTSLAAIAAPRNARTEDIHQFDEYYARNQTLGMDCEILLKTMFMRRNAH